MGNSPTPPGLLERILLEVDKRIASFARSGFLRNASITDGGLTIRGGFLRLVGKVTDIFDLFYLGPVGGILGDGNRQQWWRVKRADGTTVLRLWDAFPDPDGTLNQALSWLDRSGNTVFADDTDSGFGIARPYVPAAFYPAQSGDFQTTASTTFVTLHRAILRKQQPRLAVAAWGYSDAAGATGELRVMVNGAQLGSTATTGNTSVTLYRFGPEPVGGGHMEELWVEIQARVATGAGPVRVGAALIDGRQT